MLIHTVEFNSTRSDDEIEAIARERKPALSQARGLVQCYYLKGSEPGRYGAVFIWEDAASRDAFRETEFSKSATEAFGMSDVVAATSELMFPLRTEVETGRSWVA